MRKIALVLVVLALLAATTSALAAGKTTVDPNTPGAKVSEAAPETDTRLDQKVTYEARRKTVLAVVTDLAKMTGVTLRAGYNDQDWQVRDRKMNIFAKEVPLADLMSSIARVMKFKWSKSDGGDSPSYRLSMDRKTLLGAERQQLIQEERLRARQLEGRQRFLSGLEAAASMSESDLGELEEQSPYICQTIKRSWGRSLVRVLAEVPLARQAFLAGERLDLDYDSLPAEVQQGLAGALGVNSPSGGNLDIGGLQAPTGVAMMTVYRKGFDSPLTLPCPHTGMGNVSIYLKDGDGTVGSTISFADPQSQLSKLEARLDDALERVDKGEVDQLSSEVVTTRETEKVDPGEPLAEHPDDPALHAKVKMKVEGDKLADAFAALAKSSGFAIVSDNFDARLERGGLPTEEIEVQAVLKNLESGYRYNWEKHGSILEFRDRDWFRKRDAQIPEAWLEVWRKALKERGELALSELGQIAALAPGQIWANVLPDEVLGSIGLADVVAANRHLLSFYAGLSGDQQESIFTEQGLSLDLAGGGWSPTVQTLIEQCTALDGVYQAGLRLMGKREKSGKQTAYAFRIVTPSGGSTGAQWKLQSPEYPGQAR